MSYDQSKVAFVDIETTGLDPERDGIWEIAVIVDGHETVWQQALSSDEIANVHPKAAEITDFHNRYDPMHALTPNRSVRRLSELLAGRHLIGACPWFDSERMHRAILADVFGLLNRDLPWHYHLIDVENLAVGYLRHKQLNLEQDDEQRAWLETARAGGEIDEDQYRRWSLVDFDPTVLPWKSRDLSAALGVDPADFQPAHTALADARWAKAIYETIMGDPR